MDDRQRIRGPRALHFSVWGLTLLLVGAIAAPRAARATAEGVFVAAHQRFAPVTVLLAGSSAVLVNAEASDHAVRSDALDEHGEALFGSGVAGAGEIVPVSGIESLAPGTYPFHCPYHMTMRGTLLVQDRGKESRP